MTSPKLLLADDSVTIRKVVELTFADEGIDVFSVADGEAAMLKFIEVQPDIVLVDVEMPGPNGYQICEMIKQDEATKHIPVLLLVGSFEPFDQTEAERVQADGFLTKPFHSIRDLVSRVSDLVGPQKHPDVATPETEDIVELYNSSFAETVPVQDYHTDEDIFQGVAIGEDFIATGDKTENEVPVISDQVVESEDKEPAADATALENRVAPADFAKPEEMSETDDVARDDELIETSNPIGDDELIEELRPEPAVSEISIGEVSFHAADTIETTKDFDWSPSAKIVEEPKAKATGPRFEPRFEFEDDDPLEVNVPEGNGNGFVRVSDETSKSEPIEAKEPAEPSVELINLIAKRVIERLSDQAIRDIAQEAVPRIAEKLIREALEEEGQP